MGALEALERNDIPRLPGGIFSRAFVRSYAIEVGLDPDATIQEFITQFPHDTVTAGYPDYELVEDNEAVESDRRMAGTFLWLLALSLPIAGVVIYFATAGRSGAARRRSQRPRPSARSRAAQWLVVSVGAPRQSRRGRRRRGGAASRPPSPRAAARGRAGRPIA